MKLYFIGGASGSGKTAIMPELQEILGSEIKVYDFDDIGVPEGADKKWRQESTEKWLKKLLSYKKNTCLLGVILGEILACPSAKHIEEVHFLLLDVDDLVRIKRIRTRGDVPYNNQHMLNWASWLRVHNQEPLWEQHVIKDDSWDGLDFSTWEQNENWPNNVTTKAIDTTSLDIKEVAEQVAAWINDNQIDFKIIEHGSEIYRQAVLLREDILRKPFGLKYTEEELLEEKDHIQVVGITNDAVVATVVLVPEGLDCKMQRVVVDENLVNKGIGSKMMIFCEDYARENKFNSIYCHARDTTVNFYLRNRYIAEGDYFEEDTIPHLKMRKVINLSPETIDNTDFTLHVGDKIVDDRLFEYNKRCVPPTRKPEVIDKRFVIKKDDKVIAGIDADIYIWNILFVSVIFVDEDYRDQGLGAILLNKVESEAKTLGVKLSHLDTFDFQAKEFYEKHGYEVFGILDDCPEGHKRYYMRKLL